MGAADLTAVALAAQRAANRSGLGHEASFAGHRARLTHELLERAPPGRAGRLGLLGAGNANDVDLAALADAYGEVHLIDLDGAALEGARARLPAELRARVRGHAPVDVSGVLDRLEAWRRARPSVAALEAELPAAVGRVVARLPAPFDVVASCCLLTQLQLVVLQVVGDAHPRFPELRGLVTAVHVRVLAALVAQGGTGLLVTDMTSDETYPFEDLAPDADLGAVMAELVHHGNLIHCAHPGLLSGQVRRDPALAAAFEVRPVVGPWLWRNGPARTLLVYALELRRRA